MLNRAKVIPEEIKADEMYLEDHFQNVFSVFKIFTSMKPFKPEGSLIISRFCRRAVLLNNITNGWKNPKHNKQKKTKQEELFDSRQLSQGISSWPNDQRRYRLRQKWEAGSHHPTVAEAQDNLILWVIQISDYMVNGPQINTFAFDC